MNVILDILGSMVIRASVVGVILLTMINLNNFLFRQSDRVALNELSSGPGEVILSDLRAAGFGPSTSKTFQTASTNSMRFYADIDNSGDQETIFYSTSGSGSNKVVSRSIDGGTAMVIARDVETFSLQYFTATGAAISGTNVTGIKSISVTLIIESKNMLTSISTVNTDSTYHKSTWQRHIFPSNL